MFPGKLLKHGKEYLLLYKNKKQTQDIHKDIKMHQQQIKPSKTTNKLTHEYNLFEKVSSLTEKPNYFSIVKTDRLN